MQHDLKSRCPRQLLCLQLAFRRHALGRVHFDGDAVPFGEYTLDEAQWGTFTSGGCDPRVMSLPPTRCNEGMQTERSAQTCEELRQRHAATEAERAEEAAKDEVWVRDEPHQPPMCAESGGDCLDAGCCALAHEACYRTLLGTAHCKAHCSRDDTWDCSIQRASPPPPPPPPPTSTSRIVPSKRLRWQGRATAGVCAESSALAAGATELGSAGGIISPNGGGGTGRVDAGCSGGLVHRDARKFCHLQGARLCTAGELRAGVAQGSGCGLDDDLVWAEDFCGHEDDHHVALGGAGDGLADGGAAQRCVHSDALLPVRCCADAASNVSDPIQIMPSVKGRPSLAPLVPGVTPLPVSNLAPPCTANYQNCYTSRCCTNRAFACYQKYQHINYAQCRPSCPADGSWACVRLSLPNMLAAAPNATDRSPSVSGAALMPPAMMVRRPVPAPAMVRSSIPAPAALPAPVSAAPVPAPVPAPAPAPASQLSQGSLPSAATKVQLFASIGVLVACCVCLAAVLRCWHGSRRRDTSRTRAPGGGRLVMEVGTEMDLRAGEDMQAAVVSGPMSEAITEAITEAILDEHASVAARLLHEEDHGRDVDKNDDELLQSY